MMSDHRPKLVEKPVATDSLPVIRSSRVASTMTDSPRSGQITQENFCIALQCDSIESDIDEHDGVVKHR
jgi:hypothetical protein